MYTKVGSWNRPPQTATPSHSLFSSSQFLICWEAGDVQAPRLDERRDTSGVWGACSTAGCNTAGSRSPSAGKSSLGAPSIFIAQSALHK